MRTGFGENISQTIFLEMSSNQGLETHRPTFAEEAEWCRSQAKALYCKKNALMLLRIASAFDDLHARNGS